MSGELEVVHEPSAPPSILRSLFSPVVIIGSLGYFVDIFDLILFSVVRKTSLTAIGVPEKDQLAIGVNLLNVQMIGMLIGGIGSGVIGDKLGRKRVLFLSIALFSAANLLNAFVWNVPMYYLLRFVGGLGLAGELGAAVTMVSEALPKEYRGLGTTVVASIGVSGAVAANLVAKFTNWRWAFAVGGILGLLLLVLRVGLKESEHFTRSQADESVKKGDLGLIFGSWRRVKIFLSCVGVGFPTWFVIGILTTLSPEICASRGLKGVKGGDAIMFGYIGLVIGDISAGAISQALRSRRKALFLFVGLTGLLTCVNLLSPLPNLATFYFLALLSGFGVGFWALFVQVAAEQYGNNLRSTAASSIPNVARATIVPLSMLFRALSAKGRLDLAHAALVVGTLSVALGLWGTYGINETFGADLDFIETEDGGVKHMKESEAREEKEEEERL